MDKSVAKTGSVQSEAGTTSRRPRVRTGSLENDDGTASRASRAAQKVTNVFKSDKNEQLQQIEQDRVAQRSLVSEFREFFVGQLRRHCTGSEGGTPKAVLRTVSTCNVSALAMELMLESWLSDVEVSFKASGCSDESVNGQWRADGTHEGRRRFCRIVDIDVVIQWCGDAKEWQLGTSGDARYEDGGALRDEDILFRLADPAVEIDLPLEGWQHEEDAGLEPPKMEAETVFDYFEVFDRGWRDAAPRLSGRRLRPGQSLSKRTPHWSEIEGPYGESVLNWLWHLQNHDKLHPKLISAYKSVIVGIITSVPELAGRAMDKDPYLGETILHQACAAGDVEMVNWLVNSEHVRGQSFFRDSFLEGRISGSFLRDIFKYPRRLRDVAPLARVPDTDPLENGPTPLMVAMMAPQKDEDSLAIVRLLLRAGAQVIYYDSATHKMRYSIFHVMASSSWWDGWEQAAMMSQQRLHVLLGLFLNPHSEFHHQGREMISMPNGNDYTPLHVTAMFGNEECFIELLEHMKVPVWEWGKKQEVGFPLRELDSGAKDDAIAALELMTLYKHGNLLTLGINQAIIDKKWNLFGDLWARRFVTLQLIGMVFTAIVCLDDTEGWSHLRLFSRYTVLTLSFGFIVGSLVLFIICASDEVWFKSMDIGFFRVQHDRINVHDTLFCRNAVEMLMQGLLVVAPPWYDMPGLRQSTYYVFFWHAFASAWFLMFILFMLRYFELWKGTSAMASTLPEVIIKDMLPFGSFYILILICSAIAMRISVEVPGDETGSDHAFGSFQNTLLTLEEAIHGPDVQWRNAVENHPMAAGAIFVCFLWMTLVMMSILIAMFGSTWEDLRQHVNERFLFRRAMFCISLEKLFPQWYHSHSSWGPNGCNIGSPLGMGAEEGSDSEEDEADCDPEDGRPLLKRARSSLMERTGMNTCFDDDRWLLWNGGEHTFPKWRLDTEHAERTHL